MRLLQRSVIGMSRVSNADPCADLRGKIPEVDLAAHALYRVSVTRRNYGRKCSLCGTNLLTAYHENRLYSVKCPECDIVVLVAAGNPGYAEDAIGRRSD